MPANAIQRTRFRNRVGDPSGAVWTDAEVDALWDEGLEVYPGSGADMQLAYALRTAYEELLADSAKRTSYSQNTVSESLSDIFRHLTDMRNLYDRKVSELSLKYGGGGVTWRALETPNHWMREYPDA